MRLAYADPPYLGLGKYYPEHPEALIWDDPAEHAKLLTRLESEYDGWAYSLHSPSLQTILPLAPAGVRVAAWVKPFAVFRPTIRVAYTWEPVIYRPGRDVKDKTQPTIRDYLSCPADLRTGLARGGKPAKFCRWVLDLLGYTEGDTVEDLFPGTGVMGATVRQGVLL